MAITGTTPIGSNIVLQDTVYSHRWYDALGPYVNKVIEEFVNWPKLAGGTGAACTTTLVGAGTAVLVANGAALGGRMIITNAAGVDDSVEMQWLGEAFLPTAGNRIYFGAKFQISDVTDSELLVGLAITDTTAITAVSNGIYFRKIDGTAICNFVIETNNTETATAAVTMVAATDYTLEWIWDGTYIQFYVDGVLIGAPVLTNIPTAEYMTPTIAFQNGEAVAKNMTVDWLRCIQVTG